MNTIITVLLIVAVVAVIVVSAYTYLKNSTLENIRADVYQLFLKAEHTFTETKQGKQKMKWVIGRARLLLPRWAQVIISEDFMYVVIQKWFQAIKDLLDDGKYNNSIK